MMLQAAYFLLTVATVFFLLAIGFKAINETSSNPKSDKIKLVTGIITWQVFIFSMAQTGLLEDFSFPPRFALFFILPSFIFTAWLLLRAKKLNWITAIPIHWVILFQGFRILVETIFVFSVAAGILNAEVTIEGYNFDMLVGISAPLVALGYYKNWISKKAVLVWNVIGLLVLASVIVVFMTSIYRPELYGATHPLLPIEAAKYPYVLVAGFLMPVAVFLHVLSIAQLRRKLRQQ